MTQQNFILPEQMDALNGSVFLETYDMAVLLQSEIASKQHLFSQAAWIWTTLFVGENKERHASFISNGMALAKLQMLTIGDKLNATLATIYCIRYVKQADNHDSFLSETFLNKVKDQLITRQSQMENLLNDLTAQSLQNAKLTLQEKLFVASELESNGKLEAIAKWSKYFKLSAKKKRQNRLQKTIVKSNSTYGNKLERMKPTELLRSESPEAALDFVHRLSEGKIAMYDYKQRAKKIKGAIIVCFDESGSMKDLDEQGKGFLVALLALAKQQKRDFVFIPYSGEVDSKEIQVFNKGKYKMKDLLAMLSSYSGGGTNFKAPLNYVVHYMKQSKYGGDVLFMTDGISHLDESFKKKFIFEKAQKKFHMMSILIGRNKHMGDLPDISDEVVKLVDFKNPQHMKIFEL